MGIAGIIGWIVVATVAVLGIAIYNRLVRRRNAIANAFAQIDVQLKRRYDLIPNLVETARKYLQHERETLEAVTAARNQASAAAVVVRRNPVVAAPLQKLDAAENVLGGALGRLMAVAEAYPELKADQTMRELSEELTSTENRVGFARQAYNDAVLEFNNGAQQFPASLLASLFGFQPAGMLQATQSAQEREAPHVRF